LRSHFLKPGQRLDKTVLIKRQLHPEKSEANED